MELPINVGTPNGLFTMENTIEMNDLGVPVFQETSIYIIYMNIIWIYGR